MTSHAKHRTHACARFVSHSFILAHFAENKSVFFHVSTKTSDLVTSLCLVEAGKYSSCCAAYSTGDPEPSMEVSASIVTPLYLNNEHEMKQTVI